MIFKMKYRVTLIVGHEDFYRIIRVSNKIENKLASNQVETYFCVGEKII